MSQWVHAGIFIMSVMGSAQAQETDVIKLLPPEMEGGKPLMQVLKERHSTREFDARPLPPQVLSNLFWAASGVNRPESGKRTAPSARDWREIEVYAAMADGAYRYDPQTHTLKRVVTRDIRKLTGVQDFVASTPVDLVFVADLDKMSGAGAEQEAFYSATDTGFIAQNVYLFCASAGLATVVRGSVDRDTLAAALRLNSRQRVILAQSVGYPAGSAR
ncbi:MAG TPA: SagB/ThcOx family dehydrogenase [Thiobacillaceae bacterium]|nr:SagB/ThcOx family dehydrogenase [Thiobacillaceae bacterium]